MRLVGLAEGSLQLKSTKFKYWTFPDLVTSKNVRARVVDISNAATWVGRGGALTRMGGEGGAIARVMPAMRHGHHVRATSMLAGMLLWAAICSAQVKQRRVSQRALHFILSLSRFCPSLLLRKCPLSVLPS